MPLEALLRKDDGYSSAPWPLHGNALGLLGPRNKLRIFLYELQHQFWFDNIVLFLILASSVLLAIDSQPGISPALSTALYRCDVVFTACFSFEVFVKACSEGLIVGERAYLKDGWNVMDFTTVAISVLSLLFAKCQLPHVVLIGKC